MERKTELQKMDRKTDVHTDFRRSRWCNARALTTCPFTPDIQHNRCFSHIQTTGSNEYSNIESELSAAKYRLIPRMLSNNLKHTSNKQPRRDNPRLRTMPPSYQSRDSAVDRLSVKRHRRYQLITGMVRFVPKRVPRKD